MKDNQFTRDSYFLNARRSPPTMGRNDKDQEYAPMDEYTLIDPVEETKAVELQKTLKAQVEELLYLHPEFDDENVHVVENKGTITLMGQVQTLLDKNLAESLVMELDSVVNIINLLEIESSGPWNSNHEGENYTKGLY